MKAIDLYSGIGGWTLGMKLNGIEHVRSYEWNKESNTTHNNNFGTDTEEIDIRALDFKKQLPKPGTVDIVVGSPPCTQFSYANKGGNGNIEDGLIDMHQFLKVVEYLKPKYWAMENVPRVSAILDHILNENEDFKSFKKLVKYNKVIDSSEYGAPQKRKRMIAGDFPYQLFESYKSKCSLHTLGDVISALQHDPVKDPVYGYKLTKNEVTDHIEESPLMGEELRLNREAKTHHPIYNKMAFPEELDRPSRTITSTCTRVSRESLVIKDKDKFRRLTVRERGMLMGFPVTYQFYGNTFNAKLKMIGNAIPPVLTYYLFQSMNQVPLDQMVLIHEVTTYKHKAPDQEIPNTPPDTVKFKYRDNRSFRLAIPSFRFGSGVRFELANEFIKDTNTAKWKVNFFYGSSKKIHQVQLNDHIFSVLKKKLNGEFKLLKEDIKATEQLAKSVSSEELQAIWTHKQKDGTHPYEVVDSLSEIGKSMNEKLKEISFSKQELEAIIGKGLNAKLYENQSKLIAGILLGTAYNENMKS